MASPAHGGTLTAVPGPTLQEQHFSKFLLPRMAIPLLQWPPFTVQAPLEGTPRGTMLALVIWVPYIWSVHCGSLSPHVSTDR